MEHDYEEFTDYWINNDTIIIKRNFNDDINTVNFENCIRTLIFTNYDKIDDINKSINDDKYYNFFKFKGSNFNQYVDNLPSSLLNLTFGYHFNCTVDNLPQTLQTLTFGDYFNCTVDNLPQILQTLTFGFFFNQSVNNLPQTLLNLTFGCCFYQSVDDLPNSLITINFTNNYNNNSCIFNRELNCLPNSIHKINLPKKYNQEIKQIPSNLKNNILYICIIIYET